MALDQQISTANGGDINDSEKRPTKLKLATPLSSAASFPWKNDVVFNPYMMTSVALNVIFLSIFLRKEDPHMYFKSWDKDPSLDVVNSLCRSAVHAMADSDQSCTGHGQYEHDLDTNLGFCRCHDCYTGGDCSKFSTDCVINLDHGDPKMFESYWLANRDATTTVILGWQRMSYFANSDDVCWFLEPQLAKEIRALHELVGNAVTKNHHIVVGTGSTQLLHAALYSLSAVKGTESVDVVSAVPFYSSYPLMTDYLQSGRYKWAGDASTFKPNSEGAYIELVTSPNNPDGSTRHALVNGTGPVIYDLAYYWPHFTPIMSPEDHDIMLFSVSKSTGHAGTRIGWALVRDSTIAKNMVKFIELNTIGVAKDSQLRATRILKAITGAYYRKGSALYGPKNAINGAIKHRAPNYVKALDNSYLFHSGYLEMESRWRRLRNALDGSDRFSLQDFPPGFCRFFAQETTPHPAFAWLKCEKEADCYAVLKGAGILTRSGIHFGASSNYVRVSMLDRFATFDVLVNRLSRMKYYGSVHPVFEN